MKKKEKMKNKLFLLGMAVILLSFGLSVSGCATGSSIGGTSDRHGLISKAKVVANGGEEIASYSVILGLLDSGYEEYAAKVSAAEAAGKKITTVTTDYLGFFTKVTAYANAVIAPAPAPEPAAE